MLANKKRRVEDGEVAVEGTPTSAVPLPSSPLLKSTASSLIAKQLSARGLLAPPEMVVVANAPAAVLYEEAMTNEHGACLSSTGALASLSGQKTGRSPGDKRIVDEPSTVDDIWWGPVNIKLSRYSYIINRERALDYLATRRKLYVVDGYAGWDERYRVKIRTVSSRPSHALFMQVMLIRPTEAQLATYGEPDYVIFDAGEFVANRFAQGNTSPCTISVSFERREIVILGTQYEGEMKKGVFTLMHYILPKQGVLSLHASANESRVDGSVTLFFGLSGTGKTTLSADPQRRLIGDDEHAWSDSGIFNIEGGCYAKCANLSPTAEPDIFAAIRFGAVLENVVLDATTRVVDYSDLSVTENTRVAYPIEFIPGAKIPCVGAHPSNLVFLTCDAFGVIPPVSRLTTPQAVYHFLSGYTAKIAGTETGIKEPQATFSSCFGQPFLVLHPARYGAMLAEKIEKHHATCWLVNTGWSGGKYGVGKRMSIAHSRAIIDAIHSGALDPSRTKYTTFEVFNLHIPTSCPGVPPNVLHPAYSWADRSAFDATLIHLAHLFIKNFAQFASGTTPDVIAAGPVVPQP